MEEALIGMKKRNDELVRGNKDAIDGPNSPKFYSTNDEVLHLQEELKRREAAHTERIVEMVRTSIQRAIFIFTHTYTLLSFIFLWSHIFTVMLRIKCYFVRFSLYACKHI